MYNYAQFVTFKSVGESTNFNKFTLQTRTKLPWEQSTSLTLGKYNSKCKVISVQQLENIGLSFEFEQLPLTTPPPATITARGAIAVVTALLSATIGSGRLGRPGVSVQE